jgi:hypothetical protein
MFVNQVQDSEPTDLPSAVKDLVLMLKVAVLE